MDEVAKLMLETQAREIAAQGAKLKVVQLELDIYKKLYDSLISKITKIINSGGSNEIS